MQVSSSTNSIFTIYSYYTDLPFTTNPGGFSRQPTVAGRNTLFFVVIQGANGLDDLKETRTAILRENTHPGRSGRFIQEVGEGKICWRRESQSGRKLKEQESLESCETELGMGVFMLFILLIVLELKEIWNIKPSPKITQTKNQTHGAVTIDMVKTFKSRVFIKDARIFVETCNL